jgi:hypothetical protein
MAAKSQKVSNSVTSLIPPGTTRQTYSASILKRIEKYKADKGLLTTPEVARLAMAFFLEKQGY